MSPTPDADDELRRRLRAELDRVQPRFSSPRYLTTRARPVAWRLAPAALAVVLLGVLGLTAYSGSPNPVVWTEHVVTVIRPAATSPAPTKAPDEHRASPDSNRSGSTESPEPGESPEPREAPEPAESPEPGEAPEPSGDHTGSGSGGGGTSDSGDPTRS